MHNNWLEHSYIIILCMDSPNLNWKPRQGRLSLNSALPWLYDVTAPSPASSVLDIHYGSQKSADFYKIISFPRIIVKLTVPNKWS